MELRLQFGAIVRLHHVHAKRQPPENLVGELYGRALVARIVDLQDANARAIVNGRELVQAPARPEDALQEFHVRLQAMTGLRLLVPLPALPVRPVLLIRRQPQHPVPRQDAMHRRDGDLDLMKTLQIHSDSAGAEVVVLAQIQDFAHHVARRRAGRAPRRSRAIAQPGIAVLGLAPLPFVEGLAGNPESLAHAGDVSLVGRVAQYPQPPGC